MSRLFLIVALLVLILSIANAHETDTSHEEEAVLVGDPGTTPDSVFYFFDVFFDDIGLFFTSPGKARAEAAIKIADERILEEKVMFEKRNLNAMNEAKKQHEKLLIEVKKNVEEIIDANALKEAEAKIEVEVKVNNHGKRISALAKEIGIAVRTAALTSDQNALVSSILNSANSNISELKIKIREDKEKVKIKIKAETRRAEEDVNELIEEIEEKKGLTDKIEIAERKIEQAVEKINESQERIDEKELEGFDVNAALEKLNEARGHLTLAQEAFDQNSFDSAIQHAILAKTTANQAKEGRLIEREDREDEVEILFEVLAEGQNAKQKEKLFIVVKDQNTLNDVLQKADLNTALTIDFSTETIIAVFLGEKPTGGFDISIDEVELKDDENKLEVNIETIEPGPNAIVTQALTSPFQIVKISINIDGKEIKFREKVFQADESGNQREVRRNELRIRNKEDGMENEIEVEIEEDDNGRGKGSGNNNNGMENSEDE